MYLYTGHTYPAQKQTKVWKKIIKISQSYAVLVSLGLQKRYSLMPTNALATPAILVHGIHGFIDAMPQVRVLNVAEKPSVAREITRHLGGQNVSRRYCHGVNVSEFLGFGIFGICISDTVDYYI